MWDFWGKVWDFWHANSIVSTVTNRPPKLSFESGVTKSENKRKVREFVHVWRITTKSYLELYKLYAEQHPDQSICYGNFVRLKHFYLRPASNRELAVCLCNTHTHARRTIVCLLSLCLCVSILILTSPIIVLSLNISGIVPLYMTMPHTLLACALLIENVSVSSSLKLGTR